MNLETKAAIMIILSIPMLIIIIDRIYKLYQEDNITYDDNKKLSFKTKDRKLNKSRRCKK